MLKRLSAVFPIFGWARRYKRADLLGDLSAGLTVAVMLIPQAIAYGLLAGLPPHVALYASLVPLVVYALMGSSRELGVGPAALISIMTATTIEAMVPLDTPEYIGLALLLAMLVGAVQLVLGLVRMGFLVNLLSRPVVGGFMTAAAVIIGFSQLGLLLGVPLAHDRVDRVLLAAWRAADQIHPLTLGIGLSSIALLLLSKRLAPRFPIAFVLVAASTLLTWLLGWDEAGVAVVGKVHGGLPTPSLPPMDLATIEHLLPAAAAISMVGFMESISVAKSYAFQNRYEIDANQELMALGAGNLVGSLFGGYVVTGAIGRTVVAAQSGARTQMAGLFSALVVALTLVLLAPLFTYLPKAVLAAIIMTAVFGIIDLREPLRLARFKLSDATALVVTTATTLTFGIESGILAGVLTALALHIYQTAKPHTTVLGRVPGTQSYRCADRYPGIIEEPDILIMRVDESLYFANVVVLRDAIEHTCNENRSIAQAFILDASAINDVDTTALEVLEQIHDELKEQGTRFILSGLSGPVVDIFDRSGVMDIIGRENFFMSVHQAVHACQERSAQPPALAQAPESLHAA